MSSLGRLCGKFVQPALPVQEGSTRVMPDRIILYDTTLRDGAQTLGVDFSVQDKQAIAAELDSLGIDYIEAGWPGANPTDEAFFAAPPKLRHAKLTAFGTTCRPGRSASNDSSLAAVLNAGTRAVCLVGKASDLAAELALGVTPVENLELIGSAVAEATKLGREVLFDAEHFFDGYLRNPEYALNCLRRAKREGAAWLVLCDTNGGTLPDQVSTIVRSVIAALPDADIGIHLHNDTETAVAGSLAAVVAGARMIQGTLNGLGERCGNANLMALIPTLKLKLGRQTGVSDEGLRRLTEISHMLDERLNRTPNPYAAYVGKNAFAHKAGLHVAAVMRESSAYEHISPTTVGNRRQVVVSSQSGRSNLVGRLEQFGLKLRVDDPWVATLLEQVKAREFNGWAYDNAEASFELFARRELEKLPEFFEIISISAFESRDWFSGGRLSMSNRVDMEVKVQGTVKKMGGSGPTLSDAMYYTLCTLLLPVFPILSGVRIHSCSTRHLIRSVGERPITRVIIESYDAELQDLGNWCTIGVSEDPVDAAFTAIKDAIYFRLLRDSI